MWLRANVVLVVAVVFALVQMFASATGGPRNTANTTLFGAVTERLSQSVSTVVAQDDNDEDEDNDGADDEDNSDDEDDDDDDADNSDDEDNDDADNEDDEDNSDDEDNDDADDDDGDNDGGDNDSGDNEDDADNGDDDDADNDEDVADTSGDTTDAYEGADNVDVDTSAPSANTTAAAPSTTTAPNTTGAVPPPPPPGANAVPSPSPSPQPVVEATAVTDGTDKPLSLGGDRITVQLFSTLPSGLTVTLRMVDPLTYPAVPGIRAGDLIFQIEVKDETGAAVTTLPTEVNLTVHYTDMDVLGLNEANITMAQLDMVGNQWVTAPKLVTDPTGNTVAASITQAGIYAVYVP